MRKDLNTDNLKGVMEIMYVLHVGDQWKIIRIILDLPPYIKKVLILYVYPFRNTYVEIRDVNTRSTQNMK